MNFRRACLGSALGLTSWLSVTAAGPNVCPAQELANRVAFELRMSGRLQNYNVEVIVRQGVVELEGTITSEGQRQEAVRLVQTIPGVERVSEHLRITGTPASGEVVQTQMQQVAPPALNTGPSLSPLPEPLPDPRSVSPSGPMPEPNPIFRAAGPGHAALNPPNMPPYAWPTYAPYNNFSRVAYPTAYPYNAWPFIGPIYPFPKVPLGWRSVKLEWDDGYWWFGRVGNKHDWWKLRVW